MDTTRPTSSVFIRLLLASLITDPRDMAEREPQLRCDYSSPKLYSITDSWLRRQVLFSWQIFVSSSDLSELVTNSDSDDWS